MPKRSWSLDGDLAFRDSVVVANPTKSASRLVLDDERLLALARDAAASPGPTGSLKSICADILAKELLFGHLASPGDDASSALQSQEDNALSILWDEKTSTPRLADPLALAVLEAVLARLPEDDRMLPMGLWLAFTRTCFPSDVVFPSGDKTYDGLALSDERELSHLANLGSSLAAWAGFPRFETLVILDLAFARWTDDDMHSLRLNVGPNLAWLNLSGTSVTDAGLAHVVRGLHFEDEDGQQSEALVVRERFCRLQAVVLRFLSKVTDKGAPKLARLPSLRLVDVRDTSCTTATRYLLTSVLSGPGGAPPIKIANRFVAASEPEEVVLFSERVPIVHRLDLLRDLCGVNGTSDLATRKRLRVYIKDRDRLPKLQRPGEMIEEVEEVEEPTRARSSAHGAIYATVKVSHDTLLDDSDKVRGSAAFFTVPSHAKVPSAAPFAWRGPERAVQDRLRAKKRALVLNAEKGDEELDCGMIIRREPFSARPDLRPATVPSSNGVDGRTTITNPVKRKLLANAPGDRQQLKVRRADNARLDKDVFGRPASTPRPSPAVTSSSTTPDAKPVPQADRPRGRLQAAMERQTARPPPRAKLSAFRRPS